MQRMTPNAHYVLRLGYRHVPGYVSVWVGKRDATIIIATIIAVVGSDDKITHVEVPVLYKYSTQSQCGLRPEPDQSRKRGETGLCYFKLGASGGVCRIT
jgi:hypothetical protein